MARRLGDLRGRRVLDVGCGRGDWLALLERRGASVSGIDISQVAVEACRLRLPGADIRHGPAEELPFPDGTFDVITCMGSLEHFVNKVRALREMVRAAKPSARYLLLVPNAGFLTRRFGLYRGTQQSKVREDVLTLDEWAHLFESAGLVVDRRYRDLHVLSIRWIFAGPPARWPLRLAQAAALPFWPIAWQYQVHHLCSERPA